MTALDQRTLDNWFSYHPPTPEKQAVYQHVREQSKALAAYVLEHVPDGADRAAAIRSLRNTVMAINLAVACNE